MAPAPGIGASGGSSGSSNLDGEDTALRERSSGVIGLIGESGCVRGTREGGPGGCGGGAGGGPGAVGLGAEDGAIVESETAGGGCHHSVAGSGG